MQVLQVDIPGFLITTGALNNTSMKKSRGVIPANTLCIKVADLVLRIDSSVEFERFRDFDFYKEFIVPADNVFDCRFDHRIGAPPGRVSGRDKFYTQNWQLSTVGDKKALCIGPSRAGKKPDNVVVFDSDYRAGIMYQKRVYELFRRFISQFFIINLLSRNKGFLLHASAVVWEQKGICFIGRSGAGKSTLLDLFKKSVAPECMLNDDRCALRNYGNRWRVFGTPWHGESRIASSNSADLSALFFIRHSKRNYVRRLSASEICPQLMVLGLLPLWDQAATSRVLATFQNLILNLPAFEFGFAPGKAAVELVKKSI